MKEKRSVEPWQMELLTQRPSVPPFKALPEACRLEVVRLLVQLLVQHVRDDGARVETDDE